MLPRPLRRTGAPARRLLRPPAWKPWSWRITSSHLLYVPRSDGRYLICGVVRTWDGRWSALAVVAAKGVETQENFLANHAHKALGIFSVKRLAVRACESFGGKWVKKAKKTRSKKCRCKEI